MKIIEDYIQSLFLGIEPTSQMQQLKEDLLANAEDRYEDLKSQGKSENEALGGVISEFGTIDELLEEMDLKQEYREDHGYEVDEISLEETEKFLTVYRKGARSIGLGVVFIALGFALFLACLAFLEEDFGEGFSAFFIFLGAAVGVPLFVLAGTSMSHSNKQLDDRLIPVQVKKEVLKKKEQFHRSFVAAMVVGVGLCVLSLAPIVAFSSITDDEAYEFLGAACLFALAGFGTFFLIYGGVVMGSFNKMIQQNYFIADEGKLGPRAREERFKKLPKLLVIFEKNYWSIIAVVYFVYSFYYDSWGTSWLIFPISAILYSVFQGIVKEKR